MVVTADGSPAARLAPEIDDSLGFLVFLEYDHPDVGPVRRPGTPIKMLGMEGTPSHPAPRVGEHTDEVLGALLGLSGEQIAELRKKGAVK